MEAKHILLADTDPQAVETFRQALGPQWEITSVPSGTAALAAMKEQAYDVLVASLDLPELDGAQLLNRIRTKYPTTVRFIAATDDEKERIVKRSLGAHQFLTKPFDCSTLKSTLEQALSFEVWIDNENVRKLVSRVRTLPTIPSLYLEIMAALKSPDATTQQIGDIIAKDMAMMTKLLQVLNSAYFGLSRKITDPADAVGILGFENVKSMVVAVKLLGHYDRLKPVYFSTDCLWRHSTEVAQMARQLALQHNGDRALADAAFTGGLMHDVGRVVLACNFDEQYQGAQSLARKQRVPFWEVEREIFGATHGEIGAYLLGLWGMPKELLEVAALHHVPSKSAHKNFSALTAVHIANVLAYDASPDKEDSSAPLLDAEYLAALGLPTRLSAWREPGPNPNAGDSESPAEPEEMAAVPPVRPPEPVPPPMPSPPLPEGEGPTILEERPGSFGRRRWAYAGAGAIVLLLLLAGLGHKLRGGKSEPLPVQARQSTTSQTPVGRSPAASESPAIQPGVPAALAPRPQAATSKSPEGTPEQSPPVVRAIPAPAAAALPQPPASGPVVVETPFPAVKLQGIFYSANHPTAIINGKTLHLNDQSDGLRVLDIGPSSVTLEFENQRKTFRLR
jgi:HD-like signal output (HDOD) protein